MWHNLLKPHIQDYIKAHTNADVKDLGLKKPAFDDVSWPLVLNQIKARQKALKKFPEFVLASDQIILPDPDIIEQASSYACAKYKAGLVQGENFVDLCAGAGIDGWQLANSFAKGILIDADEQNAQILSHNMDTLGLNHLNVQAALAEEFVENMSPVTLAFLDPQRRNNAKRGLFRLEDTSPDIIALLPKLKEKVETILLKASPMLDISLAVTQLACVKSVHVLELEGECKELLFLMAPKEPVPEPQEVPIHAITLNSKGDIIHETVFSPREEAGCEPALSMPLTYLYDPGPALHKSGAFKTLTQRYQVRKLHEHTHLYTSETHRAEFPGRHFKINNAHKVDKKELGFHKANLAIRNFPMKIEILQKKLGLKDGGNIYLFACTLQDGSKALLECEKLSNNP